MYQEIIITIIAIIFSLFLLEIIKIRKILVGSSKDTQQSLFEMGDDHDVLYEDVKDFVIKTRQASASLIQRKFMIGYSRASALIDMLEMEDVVGPARGARSREVLDSNEK